MLVKTDHIQYWDLVARPRKSKELLQNDQKSIQRRSSQGGCSAFWIVQGSQSHGQTVAVPGVPQ